MSDIDVTVQLSRDRVRAERVLRRLARLRPFFPLVREINFYTEGDSDLAVAMINPLELRRDPRLRAMIPNQGPSSVAPAQRFVFLLRALDAAKPAQFAHQPSALKLKWDFYLSLAELAPVEAAFRINDLLEPIARVLTEDAVLRKILNQRFVERVTLSPELEIEDARKAWLTALWPQRYGHLPVTIDALSTDQRAVLVAQVRWEIWGLWTQRPALADHENLRRHLEGLRNVLRALAPEAVDVLKGLDEFLEVLSFGS